MTILQRYTGFLRRHAEELDKQDFPVKAACARLAAQHMEKLQAAKDAIACPWKPMRTAPKDGTAVLALLEASDVPHAVRWASDGWEMTWDAHRLGDADGPRYWMEIPHDPDA